MIRLHAWLERVGFRARPLPYRGGAFPYVYQLQDWWAVCARSNLWRPDRQLCSGPAPAKCARCVPLTRLAPAAPWNRLLYRPRKSGAR